MRIRSMFVVALAALAIVPVGAHAEDECYFVGGTEDFPQQSDAANDYNGVAFGNGGGPFGDVNRESADLLAVWFDAVPTTTYPKYQVHIKLASLGDPTRGSDVNEYVNVIWDNPRAKTEFQRQFVRVAFNGRQIGTYSWGDWGPDPVTGVNTFYGRGTTTGTFVAGSPTTVTIDIPFRTRLGLPLAGEVLSNVIAESRFLVGTAASGGYVYTQDDTADGSGCLDLAF